MSLPMARARKGTTPPWMGDDLMPISAVNPNPHKMARVTTVIPCNTDTRQIHLHDIHFSDQSHTSSQPPPKKEKLPSDQYLSIVSKPESTFKSLRRTGENVIFISFENRGLFFVERDEGTSMVWFGPSIGQRSYMRAEIKSSRTNQTYFQHTGAYLADLLISLWRQLLRNAAEGSPKNEDRCGRGTWRAYRKNQPGVRMNRIPEVNEGKICVKRRENDTQNDLPNWSLSRVGDDILNGPLQAQESRLSTKAWNLR